MANYMIEAPHTADECLAALDEIVAESPTLLGEFEWGCFSGVHNGWATITADSESAVRNRLPSSQQDNWRVTEVMTFTEEQIRAEHET
jgi:hypothetical protein